MGINNSYDEEAIVKAIATALEEFYNSLIDKIDTIEPYVYLGRQPW